MKRGLDPMTKHLVRLNKGDYERLGEIHRNRSPNEVIRVLVRRYIKAVESSEPERKVDDLRTITE